MVTENIGPKYLTLKEREVWNGRFDYNIQSADLGLN